VGYSWANGTSTAGCIGVQVRVLPVPITGGGDVGGHADNGAADKAGASARWVFIKVCGMEKLKNCPFCGSDDVVSIYDRSLNPKHRVFQCVCDNCHVNGELYRTEAEAAAAWNRRFVCKDKNGESVYEGNIVFAVGLGKKMKVVWDEWFLQWDLIEDNNRKTYKFEAPLGLHRKYIVLVTESEQ